MKPGVTLAMIVRNEADKLERCLASARAAADDIVVVDTGSTDASIETAKRHGARVREIEWPDDFSVARNVSLDMVETDWVLWLDADEWLVEGSAEAIRSAITQENAFGFVLIRRDLQEGGVFSEQHLYRLWRSSPKLRFRGVVHERIPMETMAEAFLGRQLIVTNIAFWHDGYTGPLTAEKAKRNLPLLFRGLEEEPDHLYYRIELSQTLKVLEDDGWAAEEQWIEDFLLAHAADDVPPDSSAGLFLMRRLADLSNGELGEERVDRMMRIAKGWFPDHPGVRFVAAQVEIRRGRLAEALHDLLEVERMAETGRYDRLIASMPTILQEGLSLNLALVAHQLGREDLARKHYLRLLDLVPGHPSAQQNLALLGRQR